MSTQVITPFPQVTVVSLLRDGISEFLLQDLLTLYMARLDKSEHVLAYLASVEDAEMNPWVKDDLRIAWLTVLYAARGYEIPHIWASYMVLGLHPDKVWPAMMTRREALLAQDRKKKPASVRPKTSAAAASGD
jgi:hypothetical protein